MTRARRTRGMAMAALAVSGLVWSACTMKNQLAPPLTGPSELGLSIAVSVSPDVLTQDGASQSLVTITARGPNGELLRNVSLRAEIFVNGTRGDFGTLSARNLVTGTDGRATLIYTAPASPAGFSADDGTQIEIGVTPTGSDFGNSTIRLASIRLVPPGIVVPPSDLVPSFTSTQATDHETVFFDASGSETNSRSTIVSYAWDFGDGTKGSGKTTTHSYNSVGTFSVTLTISDSIGSKSLVRSIVVGPGQAPTASFTTSPAAPLPGQVVNFNASGSQPAPGRTIRTYAWDFGDGTSGSGVQPTHAYAAVGAYVVTLVVTDDAGRIATVTQSVIVGVSSSPTAEFGFSPGNPLVGQPVNFNASASQATVGRSIVSYVWDFGDGPPAGSGVQPTHAYGAAGTYNVALTVTDDAGRTAQVTHPVTIGSDAPTAVFTFSPTAPVVGVAVNFNASGSTAIAGRTIASYTWDFGDGSAPGSGVTVTHAFSPANTYRVTLTVTDSAGRTARSTQDVAVK